MAEKTYEQDILARAIGVTDAPEHVLSLHGRVKRAYDRLGGGGPLPAAIIALIAILATEEIPLVANVVPDPPTSGKMKKGDEVIAYVNGVAVTGRYLCAGKEKGTARIKVDGSEDNFTEVNEKDVKAKPKEL